MNAKHPTTAIGGHVGIYLKGIGRAAAIGIDPIDAVPRARSGEQDLPRRECSFCLAGAELKPTIFELFKEGPATARSELSILEFGF
jgi:hypothetical protein